MKKIIYIVLLIIPLMVSGQVTNWSEVKVIFNQDFEHRTSGAYTHSHAANDFPGSENYTNAGTDFGGTWMKNEGDTNICLARLVRDSADLVDAFPAEDWVNDLQQGNDPYYAGFYWIYDLEQSSNYDSITDGKQLIISIDVRIPDDMDWPSDEMKLPGVVASENVSGGQITHSVDIGDDWVLSYLMHKNTKLAQYVYWHGGPPPYDGDGQTDAFQAGYYSPSIIANTNANYYANNAGDIYQQDDWTGDKAGWHNITGIANIGTPGNGDGWMAIYHDGVCRQIIDTMEWVNSGFDLAWNYLVVSTHGNGTPSYTDTLNIDNICVYTFKDGVSGVPEYDERPDSTMTITYPRQWAGSAPAPTPPDDLANSLVSYWPFNENANDTIGTRDGTVSGATLNSNGIDGKCYEFDGTNDSISFTPGISHNRSEFTISMWVSPDDSLTSDQTLWAEDYDGYWQNTIVFDGNWNTRDASTGLTGARNNDIAVPVLDQDDWNHIVFVYSEDSTFKRIYLDGVLELEITTSIDAITTGHTSWAIGKAVDVSVFFDGLIDEVGYWPFALTESQINEIFTNITPWSIPDTLTFVDTIFATQIDSFYYSELQIIGGDTTLGYLDAGSHAVWYDVDFDTNTISLKRRYIAHPTYLDTLRLYIGDSLHNATQIAKWKPASTGNWETFAIESITLDSVPTGLNKLYIVADSNSSGNTHWLLADTSSFNCSGSATISQPHFTTTFVCDASTINGLLTYQWKLNESNVGTDSSYYTNEAINRNDIVKCIVTSDNCGEYVSNEIIYTSVLRIIVLRIIGSRIVGSLGELKIIKFE